MLLKLVMLQHLLLKEKLYNIQKQHQMILYNHLHRRLLKHHLNHPHLLQRLLNNLLYLIL
jgi:hypothetical protein